MKSQFAQDVLEGLTSEQKRLSSKYFYDDIGSKIFQEIMAMPEYYLTDSEFEIFDFQAKQIIEAVAFNTHFNLIELGAGDGAKTARLIAHLIELNIDFTYVPIDISQKANDILVEKMKEQFPSLTIKPKTGDYFKLLAEEQKEKDPSFLLFIGGNIGNYSESDAIDLLKLFYTNMKIGDKLLVGVDLKKNPLIIHQAYFDPHGITKRFNLNLLARINKELGANFQLDYFDFYCYYNPLTGDLKSFIVSLKEQSIFIKALDKTVELGWGELIWTELSKKYDLNEFSSLSSKAGFTHIHNFLDCKHYFSDILLEKK